MNQNKLEYISKEDALAVARYSKDPVTGIENLSTVDVAPVVRCKDCKHRGESECPMYHEEYVSWINSDGMPEWDVSVSDSTRDNGFCDRGERKDGVA